MQKNTFQVLEVINGKPLKMWTEGVPVKSDARQHCSRFGQ